MYVTILCSVIYVVVCFSYKQAAASDVSENFLIVPVINDSIERATADCCTPDFSGPVVEVELKNYPEVKPDDADESDTCSNVANSVADATDESCCITRPLDTAAEDQCTSDFTSAVNEVKLKNCPHMNMEAVEENAMEYQDISENVRVCAIHI